MRSSIILFGILGLCACARELPDPDPERAWIALASESPSQILAAYRLDGERLADGRFFQVPPGEHSLEVRFQYDRNYGSNGGLGSLTCILRVRHADFVAGQRYRLQVRPFAGKAQAWLYGPDGRVLERGQVLRCGPA